MKTSFPSALASFVGWMAGAGKPVYVYIPHLEEAELMYKLFDDVTDNLDDIIEQLRKQ